MRSRPMPPPERYTLADRLHIALGVLMIPLGITILVRTSSIAVTAPGLLIGAAFVGLGVHRVWLGWTRYRLYRQSKERAT